jgi:hypothetical protein
MRRYMAVNKKGSNVLPGKTNKRHKRRDPSKITVHPNGAWGNSPRPAVFPGKSPLDRFYFSGYSESQSRRTQDVTVSFLPFGINNNQ